MRPYYIYILITWFRRKYWSLVHEKKDARSFKKRMEPTWLHTDHKNGSDMALTIQLSRVFWPIIAFHSLNVFRIKKRYSVVNKTEFFSLRRVIKRFFFLKMRLRLFNMSSHFISHLFAFATVWHVFML